MKAMFEKRGLEDFIMRPLDSLEEFSEGLFYNHSGRNENILKRYSGPPFNYQMIDPKKLEFL